MKYLTEQQLKSNLSSGKSVEQWLDFLNKKEYTVLKWLRIDKEKNGEYSVAYFESFDEGNEELLDIYSFGAIDPDLAYGKITSFDTMELCLELCYKKHEAKTDKFVNAGIIQDEYRDYLRAR